jgi:hypothetical protein
MSIWIFFLLAKVFGTQSPPDLGRAVQIVNTVALILLAVFALRLVPRPEREPWLWATALGAVNPLAVLFQRKIWSPSVFPFFTLIYLVGWWYRHDRWGALLWGFTGACLGQIHMTGFFFFAAFVVLALLLDKRPVAWSWWLGGAGLGIIPSIPWIRHVVTASETGGIAISWTRWFEFKFWTHWISEPFGWGLKYALGEDFSYFLSFPILGGQPTYLVGLLHLLVIGIGAIIMFRAAAQIWTDRHGWRETLIGTQSPTLFTINGALLGYGVLLAASGLRFHRHYLLVVFPLTFVWLAWLALMPAKGDTINRGRALLLSLCIVEALISVAFLYFIHLNQGTMHGGYGPAYGAQSPGDVPIAY